ICVTSSACAEALTIFKRVDETVDHRAEVAGMRGQEVKPSVEAGRFWVAAQIAKVFREHEGAVERGRVQPRLRARGILWLSAPRPRSGRLDRKSTRLNSSHSQTSYAVSC